MLKLNKFLYKAMNRLWLCFLSYNAHATSFKTLNSKVHNLSYMYHCFFKCVFHCCCHQLLDVCWTWKKVCLCKWRFTCVPWTTHTTWNLNMQENNLNKCHARNKFDNELVINHPRCKTNKIPIMIDMWMYIIWRFYQLVNNLQFTLSFNDNTIESLAMPPCRVCYVFKNHIIYE